jgi:hypothetical protein
LAASSCNSFQQALVMPFPPEIHHPQQSGMCFKAADVLMDQIPRHPPAGRSDMIMFMIVFISSASLYILEHCTAWPL